MVSVVSRVPIKLSGVHDDHGLCLALLSFAVKISSSLELELRIRVLFLRLVDTTSSSLSIYFFLFLPVGIRGQEDLINAEWLSSPAILQRYR